MADHAAHDPLLVAAAADRGGRLPADLAACPACTALHAELVAIAAAAPTSAIPARPRAYTLTPADAARLRPGGWRRWLAAIGSARDVVTRPLAIGFTTLGLAGLLVATVPGALPGGDGGAMGETESLQLTAPDEPGAGDAAGDGGDDAGASTEPSAARSMDDPGALLVVLSGSLLLAGGGLFVLRRVGPRAAHRG